MSDSQLDALNLALFQSRLDLQTAQTQLSVTEKLHDERLLEIGRLQIKLEVLQRNFADLQLKNSNVVEQSNKNTAEALHKIESLSQSNKTEVDNLNKQIAELQKQILESPETPSERLIETALNAALSRLHSVVLYFATATLSSNRQAHASRAFDKTFKHRFERRWPVLLIELSVKEKQVVRENIRAYVQSELAHHWEWEAIRYLISDMQESPVSWKTFHEIVTENSKTLINLVSNTEQFDSAANAVVEFILEQMK